MVWTAVVLYAAFVGFLLRGLWEKFLDKRRMPFRYKCQHCDTQASSNWQEPVLRFGEQHDHVHRGAS